MILIPSAEHLDACRAKALAMLASYQPTDTDRARARAAVRFLYVRPVLTVVRVANGPNKTGAA